MGLKFASAVIIAASPILADAAYAQSDEKPKPTYYAKNGVTPARYDADLSACIADAKKDYDAAVAKIQMPYQPGLGAAAANGFMMGLERGKLKREATIATGKCLEKKGYRKIPFTAAQLETWNKLNSEQRLKAGGVLASGGNITRLLTN